MGKIQLSEIQIVLSKGIVRNVDLGRDVLRSLRISLTDFAVGKGGGEDDSWVNDNSYGELAYCLIVCEPDLGSAATLWMAMGRCGPMVI